MSDMRPLVSVGMPTYNGERFICQSLDSLLAQDYENIELIISDNASTDGTSEICREYAVKDNRIRYYRNETNLGGEWNFNRVFELSGGKYFTWAADNDLRHPTYISSCIPILESDPEVVLVYSWTMLIDINGNRLGITPDQIDTRGMNHVERFNYIIWKMSWCNMIYGVIRREVLAQTDGLRGWANDNGLIAELSLRGSFAQIPDTMFYRRKTRPDLSPEEEVKARLSLLNTANADRISIDSLPREMERAHLRIVARAPISLFDKVRLWYAVKRRFGPPPRLLRLLSRIAVSLIPKSLRRRIHFLLRRK